MISSPVMVTRVISSEGRNLGGRDLNSIHRGGAAPTPSTCIFLDCVQPTDNGHQNCLEPTPGPLSDCEAGSSWRQDDPRRRRATPERLPRTHLPSSRGALGSCSFQRPPTPTHPRSAHVTPGRNGTRTRPRACDWSRLLQGEEGAF